MPSVIQFVFGRFEEVALMNGLYKVVRKVYIARCWMEDFY